MHRLKQTPFDTETSTQIINFPTNILDSTTRSGFYPDFLMYPELKKYLKNIIEAALLDVWVKTQLVTSERTDDPFSSIYLSELKLDRIAESDISHIEKYKNIDDLSNTISFVDEWEE